MADRLKHVGMFQQIIHVFAYLCVRFCFIVFLNLEYTIINVGPQKNFHWRVTLDAYFGMVLQMNTLHSAEHSSHVHWQSTVCDS